MVLVIDHVTPVVQGGTNDPANLITSCFDCNAGKGGHTPSELAGRVVTAPTPALAGGFQWVVDEICRATGRAQCDRDTANVLTRYADEYGTQTLADWMRIAARRLRPGFTDITFGRYVSGIRRKVRAIEGIVLPHKAFDYDTEWGGDNAILNTMRQRLDAQDEAREADLRARPRTPEQNRIDYPRHIGGAKL